MFTRRNTHLARLAAALIVVALVMGLGGALRPAVFAAESTSPITSATIDGATFTMSTPTPAIPVETGSIDYRIAIKPGTSATSIQLRIKLSTETGTLLFSRTRYLTDLSADATQLRVEQFTREVSELHLEPGTYQVVCEIAVASPSRRTEDALRDSLVVYDPDGAKVLLAPTLKISALPMRTPGGTFAVDPASPEALSRLDAVSRLAAWINSDQRSAVTLSISPLLLEEWTDISNGYTLEGSEGTTEPTRVDATEPTAHRYAQVLTDLLAATESGRLTIAGGGYADPDLTALASLGREDDILAHYRRGARTFVSAEATDTPAILATPLEADIALTAPVAATITDSVLDALTSAGIDTVLLPESAASADSPDVPSALLRHENGIAVALADTEISAALGSDVIPRSSLLAALNARLMDSEADVSAVSLTEFGATDAATTATLSRLAELSSLPWVELVGVRELGEPAKAGSFELAPLKVDESPWGGSVDVAAVVRAIDAAGGAEVMTAGIEPEEADAEPDTDAESDQVSAGTLPTELSALDAALVAEHGVATVPSAVRTAYTEYATTLASRVVGAVKLSVRSVTLPSVEGEVPITIVNNGETPLKVRLELAASGGMTFIGTDDPETISEEILLEPGETFRKPAVALHSTPNGDLTVRVLAGSYVVTEESVVVGASYINMISTVGLVVLAGLALVAYVYSRVKRAPSVPPQDRR